MHRILVGDVRARLASLKADSVVVTSPPYWALRRYGGGPSEIGQEASPLEWVAVMVEVFREIRRVLRSDGAKRKAREAMLAEEAEEKRRGRKRR